MAALAVALVWLVQAVFLSDSYLNRRVATIDHATDCRGVGCAGNGLRRAGARAQCQPACRQRIGERCVPVRRAAHARADCEKNSGTDGKKRAERWNTCKRRRTKRAMRSSAARSGAEPCLIVFSLVDVSEASRVLLQQLWIITAVLLGAAAAAFGAALAAVFAPDHRRDERRAEDGGGRLFHQNAGDRPETRSAN